MQEGYPIYFPSWAEQNPVIGHILTDTGTNLQDFSSAVLAFRTA
jgi:hypothetical protein